MPCLSFGPISHSPPSPIIQLAYGFLHIYIYLWLQEVMTNTNHSHPEAFKIQKFILKSFLRQFSSPVSNAINITMGFHLPSIRRALFAANQASSKVVEMPKGYLAAYVGEKMRRFVIPVSYLNQPSFQELLSQVEEEFGYYHPMGGLTIPCSEDVFQSITSHLNGL